MAGRGVEAVRADVDLRGLRIDMAGSAIVVVGKPDLAVGIDVEIIDAVEVVAVVIVHQRGALTGRHVQRV